ncbi:hypothetical protein [Limnovirga soli]|uniref:Lipoprotein n=1 Tax=Limnovirga soli TaxID=2656915 RepID=A0A8J8FGJ0_9BACT|nr:hypothetical protein [Limnovirga soli]NNV57645.1 hypothetical protein [Limnovirga soli]
MKLFKQLMWLIIPAAFMSVSCTSNEIGFSKDVNPETIFSSYNINYDEGDDSVNCFMQFRFAGENGTTLILSKPSNIAIDEKIIEVDSSTAFGAFYLVRFGVNDFNGSHQIVFTDINGKTHTENFSFSKINCITPIPAVVTTDSLAILQFSGAARNDEISVSISDTASATADIEIQEEIRNNKIQIPIAQLNTLSKGPIEINIHMHRALPLKHATNQGGEFIIQQNITVAKTILQ